MGAAVEEPLQEPQRRENCSSLISNSLPDIEGSLQRDAEAAYVHTEVRPPGTSPALPSPCPQHHTVTLGTRGSLAPGYFPPRSAKPGPSLLLPARPSCGRDVGGSGTGLLPAPPPPAFPGRSARKD